MLSRLCHSSATIATARASPRRATGIPIFTQAPWSLQSDIGMCWDAQPNDAAPCSSCKQPSCDRSRVCRSPSPAVEPRRASFPQHGRHHAPGRNHMQCYSGLIPRTPPTKAICYLNLCIKSNLKDKAATQASQASRMAVGLMGSARISHSSSSSLSELSRSQVYELNSRLTPTAADHQHMGWERVLSKRS